MFGRYKFSAADSAGVGATTDSKKFFLPLRRQTTSKWSWRESFVCADIIIHFGWLPSPPKEKRRRFFISPFRLRVTECSLFTVQFLVCPPPFPLRSLERPPSLFGRGERKTSKNFCRAHQWRQSRRRLPTTTDERTNGGRAPNKSWWERGKRKEGPPREGREASYHPTLSPAQSPTQKAREPRSLPPLPRTFSGFFLRPIEVPRPNLPRQKKPTSHYDRRRKAADAQIIVNKVPYALLAGGQSEFVAPR